MRQQIDGHVYEAPPTNPPFEHIYYAYKGMVYRRVLTLVRSQDDAEDLTQEVFLKALQAYPRMPAPLKVSVWLYRIATNTVIDAMRHRKLITWQSLEPLAGCLEDEAADPQTRYNRTAGLVYATLAQMPAHYRTVLLLCAEGYSSTEIATLLGYTTSGASSLLYHARQSFKQHYAALH